ncbi:MAG: phosphatidyl-myo-inositol alpha-mannosyltransferase [Frankiaceae bacterium]|jgi:phosphatidylinositol alpha-mannosyltransferase|nr:phosphatidyl-myo-inositol alpha-mannosyltransferase [Frankiaceae bacterium]
MRVGLVSPYPWDVPGGVVAHVRDLAETLVATGHDVSVITPVDDEDAVVPPYVVRAGRSVPVPFNGSVSRLAFGPVSATRVARWIREGDFDVLHVHSPETLSLSLLAVFIARGPIVATFHAANPRSRVLAMMHSPLQLRLERLSGRIAVSPAARKTIVEHLGADAVLIPNGVHVARYADASPLPGWPGDGGSLAFVGRVDEPRKGLDVLLAAFALLRAERPALRLLVAGPGEYGDLPEGVTALGLVSEADKARVYKSADVFVAPNTGGESFGIVLLEAMAAGTPIVASDLDAFRRVLDDGEGGLAGELARVGDATALAQACAALLDAPDRRAALSERGLRVVGQYDWSVVATEVMHVYETAIAGHHGGRVVAESDQAAAEAARQILP